MAKYRVTFITSSESTRHANRCQLVATSESETPILPVGVVFSDSENEAWAGYDFEGGYRGTAGWANTDGTSMWGIVDFGTADPFIESIRWKCHNLASRGPTAFSVDRYNDVNSQWDMLINPTGISWTITYEERWWTLQVGGIIPDTYNISGVVELDGSPAVATVRCYREDSGAFVEEVVSTSGTGEYIFGAGSASLLPTVDYFVLCHYGANVRPLAHGPVEALVSGDPPPDTDPDWSDVMLLLPMEEDFTDESAAARSVTVNGNAVVSSAQSKWSTKSGYFDGADDFLSIAHHADLNLGSSDFTIEFWLYLTAAPSTAVALLNKGWISGDYSPYLVYLTPAGGDPLMCKFYSSANETTWDVSGLMAASELILNRWCHIAITRSGSTWRGFCDGVQMGEITSSHSCHASTEELRVGASLAGDQDFPGYLNGVRITKGVARYVTHFTPPPAAFPVQGE